MTRLFSSKAKSARKKPSDSELLAVILKFLDQRKADDVVTINLQGKSNLFDAMVIASGTSQRHIHAMAEDAAHLLKTEHGIESSIEGLHPCDWVLVDAGDIIIHLFRPEVRAFYNLERMWDARLDATSGSVA